MAPAEPPGTLRIPVWFRLRRVRVLVCEGPALLGWIGAWRHERFGARDVAILQALVPAFRQRLRVERDFDHAHIHRRALETLLEAHQGAAFLVRHDGVIVMVNDAAATMLESRRFLPRDELQAVLDGHDLPGYRVLPVVAPGDPEHHLVLVDEGLPQFGARLAQLAERWRLTPRERQVFALLVEGAGNRSIAKTLGIGLRTVEIHVSSLLAKSSTRRRGELTASFWSGR